MGHMGLYDNKQAYSAAKKALSLIITDCQIPPLDFKPILNSCIYTTNGK